MKGHLLTLNQEGYKNAEVTPPLPVNYDSMIEMSKILAQGTSHLRVDYYEINGKLYAGELTFFDGGGYAPFYPDEWNQTIGDWIKLPIDK